MLKEKIIRAKNSGVWNTGQSKSWNSGIRKEVRNHQKKLIADNEIEKLKVLYQEGGI